MWKTLVAGSLLLFACAPAVVTEEEPVSTDSDLVNARKYDAARGNRIADTARRRVDGRRSGGMCLAEVQNSLEAAGEKPFPRLPGAVDLDNYMKGKGDALLASGYQKQALDFDHIPRGAIIAWRPGQCGYHKTYGHIEIAVDGKRACSDFCGTIKRNCGAPNIYVPVTGEDAEEGRPAVTPQPAPPAPPPEEVEEEEVPPAPPGLETIDISWNRVTATAEYSLDVFLDNGDFIGPCVDVKAIGRGISYAFKGTCVSPNIRVGNGNIRDFRICSAENGDWKQAICTNANWDGSSRKVKIEN